MKFKTNADDTPELQMGPMLDCIFLLLLYFISAAQIQPAEKYLGLMVPGRVIDPPTKVAEIRLQISENGQVFCNDAPVDAPADKDLPMLKAKLQTAIRQFGANQPVVIHPQPRVRQERIVEVLDVCAVADVRKLSFSANP
ncbi:MAG: biopolymer transporter ExbD [Lentisphaerae bacterium]|nr:biopolymer transporter ExbD [Lentisphaerota bacterium]